MTQGPPPRPVQAIPVHAIPAQALPVHAVPGGYGAAPGRPGWVTAIGVISIVIGSLGILFNPMALLWATLILNISQMTNAFQQVPTTSPSQQTEVVGDEFLTTTGMPAEARGQLIDAMKARQAISDKRVEQLDAFLTDSGKDVFGGGDGDTALPVSMEAFGERITRHGKLPNLGSREGRHFFEFDTGRMEIDDTYVAFFPADGRSTIRSSGSTRNLSGDLRLSPAQVKAVAEQIEARAGQQLSPLQHEALDVALRQSWQNMITPADSVAGIRSQITSATVSPTGIAVTTPMTSFELTPEGAVMQNGYATATAPGALTKMPRRAYVLAVGEAVVAGVLSIVLLVAGILALRQSKRAWGWHVAYAVLKIPLAVAAAWVWVRFFEDFSRSISATPDAGEAVRRYVMAGVLAVVGLAYPVALLLVLRVRAVREYYR